MVIGSRTQVRYEKAVLIFFSFLMNVGIELPDTIMELDALVEKLMESFWQEGESRALVADIICGLQHMIPAVRGGLKSSWRLLKTWQANELPNRC